jgi:hypothetical protein
LLIIVQAVVGVTVPLKEVVSKRPAGGFPRVFSSALKPATLLGMAMVARGEIGLLIIQIGLNETPFMTEAAFVTATWAIVLNTVIGPVVVGFLIKKHGRDICDDEIWGMQSMKHSNPWDTDKSAEEGRVSTWASRRHSRSISGRANARAVSVDASASNGDEPRATEQRVAGNRAEGADAIMPVTPDPRNIEWSDREGREKEKS